mmetsp:Transcript_105942/g.297893  ORF Transcript_105942/g.297893 Transcript_105942/m.297893 type:complete len:390 (+) Transcript_105942:30-1199(+)
MTLSLCGGLLGGMAQESRFVVEQPARALVCLEHFELGCLLGKGSFSQVMYARDKCSGVEYGLKMFDKRAVRAAGYQGAVQAEKSILSILEHPGVVRLHFAFQDFSCLYLALEFVGGGELASQIQRQSLLPLESTQFYAAETVVVLEYLQAKRVAHRDIKPDNLLLTCDGHIKLVDFNAAVLVPSGEAAAPSMTFVGMTPQYSPPEVFLGTAQLGLAFAVDLWALGCAIYEMLVGEPPFHAADEGDVARRVISNDYTFPDTFSHQAARDLIEQLLTSSPRERPGVGSESLAQIKRHAFFGGIASIFEDLSRRQPPGRLDRGARSSSDMSSSGLADLPDMEFPLPEEALFLSREVTPIVGQAFVARSAEKIKIAVVSTHLHEERDASAWPA